MLPPLNYSTNLADRLIEFSYLGIGGEKGGELSFQMWAEDFSCSTDRQIYRSRTFLKIIILLFVIIYSCSFLFLIFFFFFWFFFFGFFWVEQSIDFSCLESKRLSGRNRVLEGQFGWFWQLWRYRCFIDHWIEQKSTDQLDSFQNVANK